MWVPPGIYSIHHLQVSNASNITWTGAPGATLVLTQGLPAWDKFIQFNECTDLVVEDLAFDNLQIESFGGIEFYDCRRVWVNRCHAYNSSVTANPGDKDRRSFIFYTNNPAASESQDIWVTNCLIEDLQLEAHLSKGVHIQGNICRRGPVTGGILLIAANANGGVVEDVWVTDNLVEDADGAGIYLLLEGPWTGITFRGLNISRNRIKMGLVPDAGNANQKSTRGIHLVTGDNSITSAGSKFVDCAVDDNQIWVTASSSALTVSEGILVNTATTTGWDVRRLSVRGNKLYGNGTGTGISVRYFHESTVRDNEVYGFALGVSTECGANCLVDGNLVGGCTTAYQYGSVTGGNTFRGNVVGQGVTTRYNISSTAAGDYVELERLSFSAAYGNAGVAIADGVRYDQDITVSGAVMGDPVGPVGISSVNTSGIQITANVVSAGTVRVSLVNHSGASRTFGAGTVRGSLTRFASLARASTWADL